MRNYYAMVAKGLSFAVTLVLVAGSLSAQLALTRSYFSGAYTSIVGGPGTVLSTATGDGGLQAAIPIGFSFTYLGTAYTTVDVNTNGAMTFSGFSLLGSSATNQNLYNTTGPNGIIAPWMDDMTVDGSGGIYYQTAGTVGSQVFTMEWNNILSYWTGATQRLNFQVKLYEGTNVIEFQYGTVVAGTASTSESATIGVENGTGGPGNYLDIATGSSNVGNYFLQSSTSWPTRHYRLTPGAPTALAAGTYTAGSIGTYPNLSEAIADVNHRGLAGAVVIALTDATYSNAPAGGDNWFPIALGIVAGSSASNTLLIQPVSGTSTITYDGSSAGGLANAVSTTASSNTSEPIFALIGTDYVGLGNVNLTSASNGTVERGITVTNNGTADGAQFNAFANISISLNRASTSCYGIDQRLVSTPASALGANSGNNYLNLTITNVYAGIYLLGNATFPDLACQVGTSSPTLFNTIGSASANDIGGQATQTWGIRMGSQSGASIYNNLVQNVGGTGTVDGILVELSQGTTNVYNNLVRNIRNLSTTGTTGTTGIRSNVATTAGHSLRVYNNGICNIFSAYTGAASATRQIKGIFAQAAGGGLTTSNVNIENNSVYIDGSSSPNISSTCYEVGTTSGPVINVRNNIFVNATGAQTTPALHTGMRSTSATLVGNTGSVSNFNDVYVPNATQGFFGVGNTTNYATLTDWQTAMVGQDANSVSGDPVFANVSTCDLHATAAITNNSATPVAWILNDIDNQARSATTPDMGYDEYTPTTLDVGATALVTPAVGACFSASEPITARIRNWAVNTIDFAVNPVTVTVNMTGAGTALLTLPVTSGTLAPGATQDVIVGNANMSVAGTYTFNASTTLIGDGNTANDPMAATNRVFSAGIATASPSKVCLGDSTSLTVAGHNGSTIQWQVSFDNGTTWTSIPSATTSPYVIAPGDTAMYRAEICGLITSVSDTVTVLPVDPPTTQGDTICGTGSPTLTSTGTDPMLWYDAPSGGNRVNTGNTYSPIISATTTYYVQSGGSFDHVTTYAAGNGSSGNAFTVKALSDITVTNFDGHVSVTTPGTWEIWYRPNDYLLTPGSHLSQTGWTLLGTASNVPGMGPGIPTPIPVYFNLPISAGQTYSFQVFTTTGSVSYTNGTTLGAFWNANTDLEVYQGHGGTAFSGMVNSPRVFNGTIHYTLGCPTARTAVTATLTPADSVAITPSSTISCSGDSVTLTAASANTGYVYTWSPSGTLSSSTGSTVIANPTVSTSYVVMGLDSIGCTSYDTVDIAYIAKPSVTAMVAPDTICAGDSIALTSNVAAVNFQIGSGTITNSSTSYPAPFGNFYWGSRHQMLILASELQALGLGAGYLNSISFDVTNLNLAVAHENFEIKLALTSVNAITTFQAPTFTSVYYNPSFLPPVGVSPIAFSVPFFWDGSSNILVETCHNNAAYDDNISVNQSTTPFSSTVYFRQDAAGVCVNNTVTGAIAQRPNMYFSMLSTVSYDWTPSANLATPTAANTVGIATATTDFLLMVTDSMSGCVGVDTATVMANPVPVINLGNDGYFCGTDATLDAGNPGSTYAWSTADTTQTVLVNTNGTYSVDVTNSFGCRASDTVAITFTPFPTINLGADTTACQGSTIVLDAGLPGSTYVWSTTATTQTIGVTATGTYSVEVTDTFGCPGTDTVDVTFNALPNVSFTSTLDTVCQFPASITLTGGSPSGGTYTGPGVTAGIFDPSVAGGGTHTITYSFTDGNGCSNTATHIVFVDICPGISDGLSSIQLGLYPNPNTGRFTFTVPMSAMGDVVYEVADARGVVILHTSSTQPSGLFEQEVSIENFATGVYTLRVVVDGKTAQKRFVVQR
jgi:hypothetical protein